MILADPPWRFKSNSEKVPGRNPMRHYSCLTIPQLCTLPLKQVIAENAVLFLCMPSSQLVIAAHLPLVEAWGFRPSAMGFLWVKLKKGRDHGDPRHWRRVQGHNTGLLSLHMALVAHADSLPPQHPTYR